MIPAAVADSWFFWLAIIDGLAAVYVLPTVIAIARQVVARGADPRMHDAAQRDPVAPGAGTLSGRSP